MRTKKIIILAVILFAAVSELSAEEKNIHPSTGCYWEWMNGNISKDGITKDLEYMKAAGIESAFIFDAWVGVDRGPVDYGSREWIEAVRHACSEARRLGIVLGLHNSPGYTATGGPWILPEESMKELTWSVSADEDVPVPHHKMGFYRDLITFKTDAADEMQYLGVRLEKDESVIVALSGRKPVTGFNLWRGEREVPLDPFDGPRDYPPRIRVEISDDGQSWTPIGMASGPALKARDIPISFSCDSVSGRFLKLTSSRGTNLDRIEILTAPGSGTSYRRVGYTTNGQMVTAASEAGIGLECDKLSRTGVQAHFNKFLRPLLEELREYCGTTLQYILIDSWEAGGQDWTESLGVDYIMTGEGKDFLRGALYRKTPLKQRLFIEEYVKPFKAMIEPYGLKLGGEPYGNGDFDRMQYAGYFDLPMSEYWARCHYGSIERPLFVSRYAHTFGKETVGCECFTAYPGDADIPPVLSSFREDIDMLCDAGVNYFVMHCVAHQDNDSRPLTMGPFGTRLDRLHADTDSVRAITDYMRQCIDAHRDQVIFDFITEDTCAKVSFRLPRGSLLIKSVVFCSQDIAAGSLYADKSYLEALDSRGMAVAVIMWQPTTDPTLVESDSSWMERMKAIFGKECEHPELATVPFYMIRSKEDFQKLIY